MLIPVLSLILKHRLILTPCRDNVRSVTTLLLSGKSAWGMLVVSIPFNPVINSMFYLAASVTSSILILVLFRYMTGTTAVTRHAIAFSYLVSVVTGLVAFESRWHEFPVFWIAPAALEGLAFYIVFRLMAMTAQQNGVAVASVATKMSVVIPVMIGVLLLDETLGILKLLGVLAGLVAVVLVAVNRNQSPEEVAGEGRWRLPILVFCSTGLIDASFKLLQVWGLSDSQFLPFIVCVFACAFLASMVHHALSADKKINRSSFLFGAGLGVANFGTVFFIMKALAIPGWESSIIFPINHFAVVAVSVLAGLMLFREKLSKRILAGLVLATLSIVSLAVSTN